MVLILPSQGRQLLPRTFFPTQLPREKRSGRSAKRMRHVYEFWLKITPRRGISRGWPFSFCKWNFINRNELAKYQIHKVGYESDGLAWWKCLPLGRGRFVLNDFFPPLYDGEGVDEWGWERFGLIESDWRYFPTLLWGLAIAFLMEFLRGFRKILLNLKIWSNFQLTWW